MDNSAIERLEMIRQDLGMNQKMFSKVLGVTAQNYNGWTVGKFKPKVEAYVNLHKKYPEYSLEWAITGIGLMKKTTPIKENFTNEPNSHYGKEDKEIMTQKLIKIFQFAIQVLEE